MTRAWAVSALLCVLGASGVAQGRPRHSHHPPPGHARWRATAPPPPVQLEVRPRAPSPRHVWVAGYWGWGGHRYRWIPGAWILPPAVGRVWIEPRWVVSGGQWVFRPGYFAGSAPPQPVVAPPPVAGGTSMNPPPPPGVDQYVEDEVIVDRAPPSPRVEVPPPPQPGSAWVPGRWVWRNGWVWAPGHYRRVPRADAEWIPGRWEMRGNQWIWMRGHWR